VILARYLSALQQRGGVGDLQVFLPSVFDLDVPRPELFLPMEPIPYSQLMQSHRQFLLRLLAPVHFVLAHSGVQQVSFLGVFDLLLYSYKSAREHRKYNRTELCMCK